MYVQHLAGARVAFIVENDIVGTPHLLFGRQLIAHSIQKLLTGGMVTQFQPSESFFLFKINTNYPVNKAVETVFVGNGTFKNDIRILDMFLHETSEVLPNPRMDEGIQPCKCIGIIKHN